MKKALYFLLIALLLCLSVLLTSCYEITPDEPEPADRETVSETPTQEDVSTTTTTQPTPTFVPATTTTTRPTPTFVPATSTAPAEKPLTDYIGKTVADIKEEFGSNYLADGFEGATAIGYDSLRIFFILDSYYDNPPPSAKVVYAASTGSRKLLGALNGTMTYEELVSTLGTDIIKEKPEYWENYWEYNLIFSYKGYDFVYTWDNNPDDGHTSLRGMASNF